ncbi:MAG: hypothetical protein UU12_C0007G0005 [Candidatus Woesebacteria bacterium GW2011_GWA2_40_7b]|uniref:Uncharacterized protein n=1 Tax=Candidatus Woesebacteria bacterium GW2011_GWA2_40_7b TaxID=1618563 RepID=A0A0G0T299_9BACT|nr:MAG: hypothetical protein UU12_C0007G0005 [Candidatus Woesebacteria bacterium GW2011_GWA2_40_7b]
MNYYTLKIDKITRQLPIISIGANLKVASVNLLGDTELVELVPKKLLSFVEKIFMDIWFHLLKRT